MLKNYNIHDDYYVEKYFEQKTLSDETQKTYAKHLLKFCNAIDKKLTDIIDECKAQQSVETEEILSSTNEAGKQVIQRRIIKFDVDGDDSLIKKYFDQFERYCKADGNKNTTINSGFDTIRAVLSEFNVDLPKRKKLSDDRDDWNLLSKEDFQFVLADSSLMHKSLILFMLSTGMRLSDALNMTIGKYMEATSDYHDFIEVDDFIDNAPDDMQGFFDFEPQKTENNQEPTRCMTFNSPESNKFILQNLRRVKNEYLPNKFKNDPNKQKLKKSDALFGSKRTFYKDSPIPQSVSTMYGRKDKKLQEWHINKINQAINDGKISIEDYDKHVNLIPQFHAHGCRKYFCTMIERHTTNERRYRLMEGHAPRNKLDKSYIDFAKKEIAEVYDDAVGDLSVYYTDENDVNKVREEFNQQMDIQNEEHAKEVADLKKQIMDEREKHEKEINNLKASNNVITTELADIRNQMDNVGLKTQMVDLQRRAAEHHLVQKNAGLMEYVMTIFKDTINFNERSYYSDAEIDDMVRLALVTKNRIEKMENTLTEEILKEQYPNHYDEVTELVNYYRDKYVDEEFSISLSDSQNKKINKALLQFKKEILEKKSSQENNGADISMLVDPNVVNNIIDESLGLLDSVEAIFDDGNGHVKSKFTL